MAWLQLEIPQPQSSMAGFSVQLHLEDFFSRVKVGNQRVLKTEAALPPLVHSQSVANNLNYNTVQFTCKSKKGAKIKPLVPSPVEAGCLLAVQ